MLSEITTCRPRRRNCAGKNAAADAAKGDVNRRETAARIVLVDDILRAMTRQVQYMAIHCTPKMKELNLCTNTRQNLHVNKNDTKI